MAAREVTLSRASPTEKWGLGIFSDLSIKSVAPGTPAERAQLARGERIESVNGTPLRALPQLLKTLKVMCPLRSLSLVRVPPLSLLASL